MRRGRSEVERWGQTVNVSLPEELLRPPLPPNVALTEYLPFALMFLKATTAMPFLFSLPDFVASVLVPFFSTNLTLPVPARQNCLPETLALAVALSFLALYVAET